MKFYTHITFRIVTFRYNSVVNEQNVSGAANHGTFGV